MTSQDGLLLGFEYCLRTLWEELLNRSDSTAYFVQDSTGRYLLASEGLAKTLNKEVDSIVGSNDVEMLPAISATALGRAHEWVVLNRRSLVDDLIQLELPHCGNRWVVLTKLPVIGASHQIQAVVGTYRLVAVPSDTERNMDKVAETLRMVRDHITDPHSLSSLAKLAEVSSLMFERRVKHALGISTREYIVKQRLALAKDLLRDSDLGIQQIATACGYLSQSAFIRQFRLNESDTPLVYRKKRIAKSQ